MNEPIDPLINDLNRPFWQAAAEGRLVIPYCVETARAFWPPSPLSPYGGGAVEWRVTQPTGIVDALVVYRRPFQQVFVSLVPYGVAQIALDAGVRLQAHVRDPDTLKPGDRVMILFAALLSGGPNVPSAEVIR